MPGPLIACLLMFIVQCFSVSVCDERKEFIYLYVFKLIKKLFVNEGKLLLLLNSIELMKRNIYDKYDRTIFIRIIMMLLL